MDKSVVLVRCNDTTLRPFDTLGRTGSHHPIRHLRFTGFHFLTLEGEWELINVIVSPGLVVHDRKHLHGGRVLLVEGMVQRETEVINIIAQRVGTIGRG